jgi:SAM-dependent methyltransferase
MLLSRLVSPSGEVVAIERDARSINRAQTRAAEAGLHNVRFAQTDIAQFSSDASFDALVGRYILQFLPDPVGVLRSLSEKIRPGGTIAFQEGAWKPFVLLSAHLPLWSASVWLLHESAARSGVNVEMGPALYKVFQDAGYPRPLCVWKWSWGMIQISPDGFPTLLTASARRSKSSNSRLRSWGTSTRYSSGYKRKLHLRTPLCPGLRWWEPGATSP